MTDIRKRVILAPVTETQVIKLTRPVLSMTLRPGASLELKEGVSLTLDAGSAVALLEVGVAHVRAMVQGEPVFDVKHVPRGTPFSVDDDVYTLLPPFHAHIRGNDEERRVHGEDALRPLLAQEAFQNAGLTSFATQLGTTTRKQNLISLTKGQGSLQNAKRRLRVLSRVAYGSLALIGLVVMAKQWPRLGQGETSPAKSSRDASHVASNSPNNPEPQASTPKLPLKVSSPSLADERNAGLTSQVNAAGAPLAAKNAKTGPEVAEVEATKVNIAEKRTKNSPRKYLAPENDAKAAISQNDAATRTEVKPAELAEWQLQLERFVLEANYDPDRASGHMQDLLKKAPAGHPFAARIKREIAAIKR